MVVSPVLKYDFADFHRMKAILYIFISLGPRTK